MPKCFYKDCTSKSKESKLLRYHPFPKPRTNLMQCLLWLELCGNDKLTLTNISRNTYVCEKHFDGGATNPIPFYETTGEDPRKFRSEEIGRMIDICDVHDEYTEIVASLENLEVQVNMGDHNYSSTANATTYEDKAIQTVPRNLFGNQMTEDARSQNIFCFESLSKSDHFYYFTGLTVAHFEAFYKFLDPTVMPVLKYTRKNKTPLKSRCIRHLTDKDKLCLSLIRLKRGYTLKELSIFYRLSVCWVSVVFHTWIQFMYLQCCCLRNTLVEGSRNMMKHEMPACFRVFNEHVTIVLDATEINMQMSKNFQRQGNTFSSYKHSNTVKFLVGISTKGAIIYNSEGYEGSISDNELFLASDIQEFLREGDVLMVDKGFTILDVCHEKKFILLQPPFLEKRLRLTPEEEILTKKIAKARIHVERAIQRIKRFQILAKPIQITMLPLISNILSIVCFIVNFEKPLVT